MPPVPVDDEPTAVAPTPFAHTPASVPVVLTVMALQTLPLKRIAAPFSPVATIAVGDEP